MQDVAARAVAVRPLRRTERPGGVRRLPPGVVLRPGLPARRLARSAPAGLPQAAPWRSAQRPAVACALPAGVAPESVRGAALGQVGLHSGPGVALRRSGVRRAHAGFARRPAAQVGLRIFAATLAGRAEVWRDVGRGLRQDRHEPHGQERSASGRPRGSGARQRPRRIARYPVRGRGRGFGHLGPDADELRGVHRGGEALQGERG
mmetsp:Transcript_68036/g.197033  ORF Transcript_68036/g.197033 Transcript_68036/m.197033 type:complete len:205 (+) Transcript_68036:52-666(+)